MNLYRAYGLNIRSEIPLSLPLYQHRVEMPDIIIKEGLENIDSSDIFRKMPELFSFTISKSGLISIDIHDRSRISFIASIIRGELISAILRWWGYLIIHASAIEINEKTVVFMGHSGAGKSTTALYINKIEKKSRIITDDLLPLTIENKKIVATPSFPRTRLYKDSGSRIFEDYETNDNIHDRSNKKEIPVSESFSEKKSNVSIVFVIKGVSSTNRYKVSVNPKKENFAFLMSQIWSRHLAGDSKYEKQDFFNAHHFVSNIPMYSIYRSSNIEDLKNIRDKIYSYLNT